MMQFELEVLQDRKWLSLLASEKFAELMQYATAKLAPREVWRVTRNGKLVASKKL